MSSRRREEEIQARKLRQEAQKHLDVHSCGPSRNEIERQKKPLTKPTSSTPNGDNTLELLARQKRQLDQAVGNTDTSAVLPTVIGWKKLIDSATGDAYFWNQETGETSWENPKEENLKAEENEDDALKQLPKGWTSVVEPNTGETYYWNQESGETTCF